MRDQFSSEVSHEYTRNRPNRYPSHRVVGVIPHYPYSTGWGYGPSGLIGVLLIVVLILLIMGRI